MAKMTIAQLREVQLEKFNRLYIQDMDTAKKLINRYYRLCGMDERLLYLTNDSRTADRPYTRELEAKAEKSLKALQADFKTYGLKLVYFGYFPTICEADSTNNAYYAYFYN